MSYWRGKRAVVTGGSAGLGCVLATTLAAEGAHVMLAARGTAGLEETQRQIKSLGHEVLTLAADMTQQADVDRLAETVGREFGGLDALCHCAGQSMRGTALATKPEEYQDLIDTNFISAVRCVQALANPLIESRGHIVLVGSLATKVAPGYLGAYPASKHPLAAFAQQLRMENHQRSLHVLLVCPGPIAREDAADGSPRYAGAGVDVPAAAHQPGGGAKVKAIDPRELSLKILRACETRNAEFIVPWSARLLFTASQLSPAFGDWLLRRMMSS